MRVGRAELQGAAMVPMEIIDRTFCLSLGDHTGTAFTIDVGGRQYVVTARHVVAGIIGQATVGLKLIDGWRSLDVALVGHAEGEIDVSVLTAKVILTDPGMAIPVSPGNFYLGQDVYFAGFPLGFYSQNIDSPFPSPLVKRAIISGKAGPGFDKPWLLDGHNNGGFSGGPVFARNGPTGTFSILAIISSYFLEDSDITDAVGEPTVYKAASNAGIIAAYSIQHALELIAKNPNGLQLPS